MLDSLRLAVALAELGVARAGGKTARRLAWTTVLTVIAAVAAVASAAFAIASLWFALAPMIGRPEAALILAGILFAFCLIGLLGSRFLVSRKPERALAAGDIDAALAIATNFVKKHKSSVLLTAFLAGLLASETGNNRSRNRR